MSIIFWVMLMFVYLVGGAIFAGVIELGDIDTDLFAMVFWPIVAIFILLLKITRWTSDMKHKYEYNRKLKYKNKEE